jgi:hypothetical protein
MSLWLLDVLFLGDSFSVGLLPFSIIDLTDDANTSD